MHFRMLRYVEKPWQRWNTTFFWCNIYFDFIATVFLFLWRLSRIVAWYVILAEMVENFLLGPRSLGYDGILKLHWIHHIILDKMRSCLWKTETEFWSYCLVNHLGPIGPKLVFRLQNSRSSYFINTW